MKRDDAQKLRDADLRAVMATPAGRRFVWRLLTQSGLHGASFAESPTATAYNEGRRSVAIGLVREAQRVAPEHYATSLREQLERDLEAVVDASNGEAEG